MSGAGGAPADGPRRRWRSSQALTLVNRTGGMNLERPHHCAFVDAPMGDASLRVDCPEQEPADAALADRNWRRFVERN